MLMDVYIVKEPEKEGKLADEELEPPWLQM